MNPAGTALAPACALDHGIGGIFVDQATGIRIVPIGELDPWVPRALRGPLEARFDRTVRVGRTLRPSHDWYAPARGQYRADRILDHLSACPASPNEWLLAIIDADLYAPGLNFIFGQATVGGCCAVIGLARLRRDVGGDAPDHGRFRRRVLTEAVHELGHVAGLGHCGRSGCVMFFSNTLAETDRKGPDFCVRCRPGAGHRAA